MPRDGSGVYTKPFPDVVDGTTIESAVYNGYVNDVTTDLNAARPIVAGGTGANNAATSLFNLGGEKAAQVVTNYDSHVWVPGSFRSAASATGAPNAHAFAGTCYIGEALANPPTNQNVVVEARDLESLVKPGQLYTRQKTAGVWSGWSITDTGDDQAATRQVIYAAPFDALAYNGMQINGSMDVSQEKGLAATTVSGQIVDGWALQKTGTMSVSAQQLNDGASNMLVITVATAEPTLAGTDNVRIYQPLEGWRVARLKWGFPTAHPITIGFYTAHHRPGIYSVAVQDTLGSRCYVTTYTQNVSDAYEYKTITIPGCTDGTWNKTNAVGMYLFFTNADNGAPVPAINTWSASSSTVAPGQVNGVAATSDIFRIAGVVVLPGIEAPSAARSSLIMRPYDQELLTCQRYYTKTEASARFWATGAGQVMNTPIYWQVQMRAAPTVTSTPGTQAGISALGIASPTVNSARFEITAGSAGDNYALIQLITADARL